MRRASRNVLLMALALSIVVLAHAHSEPTDEQARQLAADSISKMTGTSAGQLTSRRREDLEDALFSVQTKIAGHIHKAAYFYSVLDGGYQLTPIEVTYSRPAHQWLVAVSTAGNTTYGLEGVAGGEAAFNKLTTDSQVEIRNASQAESFTRFYLDCVYGNASNIVYDELRLRHKVEEHFVGYAETQDTPATKEQRFRQWWAAFKARRIGPLAPTVNENGENQYLVLLDILDITVGFPPGLSQWSVSVRSDGTTRLMTKHVVFSSSATSSKSIARRTNADTR